MEYYFIGFFDEHSATLLGLSHSHGLDEEPDVNPRGDLLVSGGMALFYMAKAPLELDWSTVPTSQQM